MSDVATSKLEELRSQINQVDDSIQALLQQRAQLALDVATAKKLAQKNPDFYRPEREAQLLSDKLDNYQGLLPKNDLAMIFRHIMSACRGLQQEINIAFLGPLGTFSHAATQQHFGSAINFSPVESIEKVFQAVQADQAHYGVVPVENSTDGVITLTLDLLIKYSLNICGEIILPVHQHLLRSSDDQQDITAIYSHQQSFQQCKQWLDKYYPDIERIVVSSNAKAAKIASENLGVAAIAGDIAADYYNLVKQEANIADNPKNTTRFFVIGKQKLNESGQDKTSLVVTTPHQPGALINLMQPFAEQGVNVTFIQSRPYQHQNWCYIFFVELEGHQNDDNFQQALQELAKKPIMYNVLGSYPKAIG